MSRPLSPSTLGSKREREAIDYNLPHSIQQQASVLSSPVSLQLAHLKAMEDHSTQKGDFVSDLDEHAGRWGPLTHPRAPQAHDVFGGPSEEHNNSLGLFGSFPVHAPTHSGELHGLGAQFTHARGGHHHSDSTSSRSSISESGMYAPAQVENVMLQRHDSLSNSSSASSASVYYDDIRSRDQSQTSPSAPFSISESSMGLQGPISTLAISTPQAQMMQARGERTGSATSSADHSALLSLSGHESLQEHHDMMQRNASFTFPEAPQLMAPPPANKRRATQLAHSLYTSDVRQLRTEFTSSSDDSTPMPSTTQAFHGPQAASDVADMAASGAALMNEHIQTPAHSTHGMGRPYGQQPNTPASNSSAATMMGNYGQQHAMRTPSHIPPQYSPFTFMTPQYGTFPQPSPEGTTSGMGSSLSGSVFSAPRLARMDSFESTTPSSGLSSPASEARFGSHGPTARSLEMAFEDHEAKATGWGSGPGPHDAHLQGPLPVNPGVAMSRIASAPPHSFRNADIEKGMPGGPPSTPQRSQVAANAHAGTFAHQYHEGEMLPATPSAQMFPMSHFGSHPQLAHLTMSAPPMATSRSMGFLSSPHGMPSPTSSVDGAMGSMHTPMGTPQGSAGRVDAFGSPLGPGMAFQSPSSGVFRTQTGRARGTSQGAGNGSGQVVSQTATHGTLNKVRPGAQPPLIVSSADKLHVCHCGKRFKRLEHLKRHSRVHTQERPHQCPAPGCKKWFGRTDNLTQHLRTHYRTLGRSSESLLRITQSAATAAAGTSLDSPQGSGGAGLGAQASMQVPESPLDGLQLHQAGHISRHAHSLSHAMGHSPMQQASQAYDGAGAHLPPHARNDPHAAAAAAAAACVVNKKQQQQQQQQLKRRITISNDALLGGPITLVSPTTRSHTTATGPSTTRMKQEAKQDNDE